MTIKTAYQLHLYYEIGSIEFSKKADFCVLEADPQITQITRIKKLAVELVGAKCRLTNQLYSLIS